MRQVEEMAISAEEINGSVPEGGYGIYLNSSTPREYFFFADENGNQSYDEGEKIGNNIFFEDQTEIKNFFPSETALTVIFQPPEPLVIINGDVSIQSASITIGNNDNTETISVNRAGLIYVE
jgi:Tfp pilus assembly protein FimT